MPKAKTQRDPHVRGRLEIALKKKSLIRVSRTIRRSDKIEGFVVGIGQTWVLLADLDPRVHLNGYVALRVDDVLKVQRRGGPDTFVGRTLSARGEWPPVSVDVDLDTVAALVRTAAEVAPLVTLHIEEEDPTVCFIGHPMRISRKAVHLLETNPQAEWRDHPTKWSLSDITRVDFGGGYEQALALIGGTPPGVSLTPPSESL
jgi:hypothetical protein